MTLFLSFSHLISPSSALLLCLFRSPIGHHVLPHPFGIFPMLDVLSFEYASILVFIITSHPVDDRFTSLTH